MYETIRISDITSEQLNALGAFLERSKIEGFEGHRGGPQGLVKGDCFSADYHHDADAGELAIDLHELPDPLKSLPPQIGARAFEQLVRSGLRADNLGTYGVYDYVIPTIDNNVGSLLTFSSSSMTNGTISITNNSIKSGAGALQAFEADSTKLSGTGVGGTVVYTFGDGQTALTIEFFLNTIWTHTFTVGVKGPNAPSYTPTVTGTDPTLSGYTYLKPAITLTLA